MHALICRTAARCALPTFDSAELIAMIADQIRLDREWVPSSSATASLYIRPTLIATDVSTVTLAVNYRNLK